MSKYRILLGDSLWSIANKMLGDGNKYKDIIDANNLTEKSVIYPGLILNIPDNNLNNISNNLLQYTVQSGDNLSKIALSHNTTSQEILKINNINNPNLIKIGLVLNIPKLNKYIPSIKNFKLIKLIEENINKGSDLDIINTYHKLKLDGLIYLVDDKKNNKLSVYRDGKLLKSYKAIHGKNRESDDMTITYTDSNGKLINLAGNLSTPAGVYFTTKGGVYHGAPSFIRRTKELVASNNPKGIPSSIHARTIYEGANTNGCTGMNNADLKDLAKYINLPNVPTYILPADNRNKFFIRNGLLQFKSYDILRTPSYNTLVNKPIKYITYNTNNLTDTNKNIIKLFSQGLIEVKKSLLKDLGINNDTYNELALSALGILGVESGYGNENTAVGNLFRAARKFISNNNSSPDYKSKYFTYGINGNNNSIGLTQIRFSFLSDREKALFKKYNITKDSLVTDPKKAAIATMIKLGQNYLDRGSVDKAVSAWNNKPSYLSQVNKNKLKFNLFEMYRSGGILKNLNGNSFKRLDIKGLLSDPEWKNYLYKLHPKNLEVLLDSMKVRNMGFPLRVAVLSLVIPEKGGDTGPHGNGAYGLVGWRGDRAVGLGKTIQEQTHKLMEEIHNNNKFKEWNHGGKGTGVLSGKEMQQLFKTTPNTILATKAFMKGYVRPPADSMLKRIDLSNLLKKYMK